MSQSKKKQKSNVNKGYPRRVIAKYGLPPSQEQTHLPKSDMTTPHHEREPGSTISQKQNADREVVAGTEVANAEASLSDPSVTEPRVGQSQIASKPSEEDVLSKGMVPNTGGIEVDADSRRSGGRNDKRTEPQNLTEFIEAFLTGKVKSLSEPVARRLKSSSPQLEPVERGNLLRCAQVVDGSLDKVRRLMLAATALASHKPLAYLVMEFCVDCTLANRFIRADGMRSLLFPGHHDVATLEEAWARLQSLPVPTDSHASVAESEDSAAHDQDPPACEDASIDDRVQNSKDGAAKTASARTIATTAGRSRRNALWCAAIWRVRQDQMAFAELVRAVRTTLFSLKKRPESLEDELLEALANVSDKEAEPLALLWEWNVRQQTEVVNRLVDANRRVAALDDETRELKERLALALTEAQKLQEQLADERAAKQASETALNVAQTHGQADLEEMRALALNTLREAVSQLDVVSEALKREPPKVLSALDKVDAVMDRLKATNEKLENP